jgi:hypothetical protein
VFVSAVEFGLGVVVLPVLAAGVRLRAGWLPRAVVAVGVLGLLGLAELRLTERRDDWRGFNLGRRRARELLAQRPAGRCEKLPLIWTAAAASATLPG